MKIVSVKMPIDEYKRGIKTARESIAAIKEIESNIAAWGTEESTREKLGAQGVEKRAAELPKLEQQKAEAERNALAALGEIRAAALEYIEQQTDPDGADIIGENAADFALIANGLITTPAKLERVLAKHDNVAFRTAAAEYAKARSWAGFNSFENAQAVSDMTAQIFDGLNNGVQNTSGIAAMQYTETPDEYARLAGEYGLTAEFSESGGASLAEY